MSFQDRLAALITAIGADIKALFSRSVPAGGETGQVLTKTGSADYEVGWATVSGAGATGDPHWNSVICLLKFDGANGSTTFTDLKGNVTITRGGTSQPTISTAQSVFGGASLRLTGAGYLDLSGSVLDLACLDSTIEYWVYGEDQTTLYASVLSNRPAAWSAGAFTARFDESGQAQKYTVNWFGVAAPVPVVAAPNAFGAWQHVAIVRDGFAVKLYVNGTLVGQALIPSANTNLNLALGGSLRLGWGTWDGANGYFTGYIDSLRITKGVARYRDNFIAPTAEFPVG